MCFSHQVFGTDSELFSMNPISKFGCKLEILETLKESLMSKIMMFKEEQWVLLHKNITEFTLMEFQQITIMQNWESQILPLAEEECGISVLSMHLKHIEKNSAKEFTVYIKLVLTNAKNYTIIVNNVVIRLSPNLKEFLTSHVGEVALMNPRLLVKGKLKLNQPKLSYQPNQPEITHLKKEIVLISSLMEKILFSFLPLSKKLKKIKVHPKHLLWNSKEKTISQQLKKSSTQTLI